MQGSKGMGGRVGLAGRRQKERKAGEVTGKRRSTGSEKAHEKATTKAKAEPAATTKRKMHSSGPKAASVGSVPRLSLTEPRSKVPGELCSATEREIGKRRTVGLAQGRRKKGKKAGSEKELRIEDLGRTRRSRLNSPKRPKSTFLPSPSRQYAHKYTFQSLPRSLSPPLSQSTAPFPASQAPVSLRLDTALQKSTKIQAKPSSPLLISELSQTLQPEEVQFRSLLREICGSEDCALALEMQIAYKELKSGCYQPPQLLIMREKLDLRPSSPPSHPELAYISEKKTDLEEICPNYVQEKGKLLNFTADSITEDLFSTLLSEIGPILTISASAEPPNGLAEGWKVPTDSQSISVYVHFLLQISQSDLQTAFKSTQNASNPQESQSKWCKYREIAQIPTEKYEELEQYRDFEVLEKAPSGLYRILLESHQIHDRLLFDSVNELLSDYSQGCLPCNSLGCAGSYEALAGQISRRMSDWNRVGMGSRSASDLWERELGERVLREGAENTEGGDWERVGREVAEELLRGLAEETVGLLKRY